MDIHLPTLARQRGRLPLALALAALLLLLALPMAASAQTRAWLDRDRVAFGETATLNIETDQVLAGEPDYAALAADFSLAANTSSRQVERVNGRNTVRSLFAVALRPRREGVLSIPSLRVGAAATQPLSLTVTTAAPAARAGAMAFIEAESDAGEPYVQQAVGYTVRLYYATPLISGQLEQPTPEGAALQRVGQDLQYSREVGGRRYTVVERRFLLVPERSGTLTIPGARFEGRGAGSFLDDMFGDGQRPLSANGAPRFLRVRPVPANAPQPWLPLRALGLRYVAAPQSVRVGEAATITLEATADGASAAQMPELALQVGAGAQVFAEPVEADESFNSGRPQVTLVRRFSIVPSRAGTLRIPGARMAWWDVRAGVARTASLPDIQLQVAPAPPAGDAGAAGGADAAAGVASLPGDAIGPDDGGAWIRVPGIQGPVRPWALATVVFALLWLVTLAWGLHRGGAAVGATRAPGDTGPPRRGGNQALRQALQTGDLGEVATALCATADPPAADLDALRERLDDPVQRAALDQLQRARWAGGDGAAARVALREAFKHGPRWRQIAVAGTPLLPPLYPPR